MVVSYNLATAEKDGLAKLKSITDQAIKKGYTVIGLTASGEEDKQIIKNTYNLDFDFYLCDEKVLKTIVRSNPGFLLISNGTIIGKWGFRDFPSIGDLNPHALELMGNAAVPLDEEARLLMEAGIYEDFSFSVLEFDTFLPSLIYEKGARDMERIVVVAFILVIFLVILLSGIISPVRT